MVEHKRELVYQLHGRQVVGLWGELVRRVRWWLLFGAGEQYVYKMRRRHMVEHKRNLMHR